MAFMKKQVSLLLLAFMFQAFGGCKKDGEVNAILATIDSFTSELVNRIETAGNPSTGVDDARKYFDYRKEDVRANMDSLKRLRESQVSDATKQRITSSLVDDASRVGNLEIKYVNQSMSDPAFKAKLDKLIKDYRDLLAK
jgi:hypothetical protein